MIDMHYDLLSVIYQSYLRMDYSYLEEWLSNYNSDNVSGLLANMYFMSPEEMKEELGETLEEIDVLEMFKKAIEIFNEYNLNIDILFSIEGCDYIKDTEELDEFVGELQKFGSTQTQIVFSTSVENRGIPERSDD